MLDLPLATPALPLDEAGKYVAAAYMVFLVLLVVYVGIMATKLARIERELRDLAAFAEEAKAGAEVDQPADSSRPEEHRAAPGRGSEARSMSVPSGPSESRGGGG